MKKYKLLFLKGWDLHFVDVKTIEMGDNDNRRRLFLLHFFHNIDCVYRTLPGMLSKTPQNFM